MAIRIRRGNAIDFDKNKLVAGELGLVLDAGELHFCYSAGNTKKLQTAEDLQAMLDASGTAYSALQALIADLELNPSELTNILNNITALQTGKLDKIGDSKDNVVSFTESATESDIATGDTHEILFGKILKKNHSVASQLADIDNKISNTSTYLTEIKNMMRNGETVVIVAYGNSTTWGDNSVQIQVAHPYPETLQARLRSLYNNNNITVINKGYCGLKSDQALALFDSDIVPLNPDLLIMDFGINDASGYVPPINSIDDYRANMIGLVDKCATNNYKAILLTPTFTQMLNWSNTAILEYGECTKEIALVYSIPCIDMHKAQEKLYQSGSQSISVGMIDGAHMTDIGYQLMADIILQEKLDINAEKALVVSDTNDKYIPVVGTKYIKTDCTGVHVSDSQYMKNCYTFKKDGSFGTYLSVEFYVNQANMDMVLFSPKATGGGTLTVIDNGVSLTNVINFYSEEQNCYDAPSIVAENLSLGYHKIEFKTANLVDGDATTDIANAFTYISYFMFTKNKLTALNSQDISTTSDTTIEKFIPILNEKHSLNYNTGNAANATLLRTEKYCQTKTGKTLIIEFDGYLFDKCGVNWFGNKKTLGATYGYYLVFDTTALTMYHSGIGGSPAGFTDSVGTVTLNFAIPHNVRIEHSFSGQIKVYIDGVLYITCTSKYSNSGYFGLYNRQVAGKTMTLTRFEYAYK